MNKIVLLLVLITYSQVISQNTTVVQKPIHQLRIYELTKENSEHFHIRFRDHAARIMKNYGFNIVALWESEFEDTIEFVYLLEWESPEALKAGWDQFMKDSEWKNIKKRTSAKYGSFVENITDRKLLLRDYSPSKYLSPQ